MKNSHPLQGALRILMAAEEARERDIPLFAAQTDLKKAFDHVDRNQALKAMKRTRSRQTAPGMDLTAVGTTQFTNEAKNLRVDKLQNDKEIPQGAPESSIVFK